MAAVMRQGTKAQSGGLVTGTDWSASQVIQPVDLSALLHWLGVELYGKQRKFFSTIISKNPQLKHITEA